MYIHTHHIKMKFNGRLDYSFSFDIRYTEAEMYDCTIPNADLERIFKIKEDGYLYIQGHRITNNKDGIRTVYSSVMGRAEEGYIDVILSIDYNGYVVIAKHQQTNNQVSRFLNKILG